MTQDCVIIPTFGTFVFHTTATTYDKTSRSFFPAQKRLSFDPDLFQEDDALILHYAETLKIGYKEAEELVQSDVYALKETLHTDGFAAFGEMGSFSVGKGHRFVFTPSEGYLFDNEYALLPPLKIKTAAELLDEKQREATQKKKEEKKRRRKRRLRRVLCWTWGVAAAVVLALFLLKNFAPDGSASGLSALLPTPKQAEMRSFPPEETPHIEAEQREKADTTVATAAAEKTETVADSTTIPTIKETKKEATAATATALSNRKYYYTIIASLPNEELAKQYLRDVDTSNFPNTDQLHGDNRIRVYTNRFLTHKEAREHLEELRAIKAFRDAWIMRK